MAIKAVLNSVGKGTGAKPLDCEVNSFTHLVQEGGQLWHEEWESIDPVIALAGWLHLRKRTFIVPVTRTDSGGNLTLVAYDEFHALVQVSDGDNKLLVSGTPNGSAILRIQKSKVDMNATCSDFGTLECTFEFIENETTDVGIQAQIGSDYFLKLCELSGGAVQNIVPFVKLIAGGGIDMKDNNIDNVDDATTSDQAPNWGQVTTLIADTVTGQMVTANPIAAENIATKRCVFHGRGAFSETESVLSVPNTGGSEVFLYNDEMKHAYRFNSGALDVEALYDMLYFQFYASGSLKGATIELWTVSGGNPGVQVVGSTTVVAPGGTTGAQWRYFNITGLLSGLAANTEYFLIYHYGAGGTGTDPRLYGANASYTRGNKYWNGSVWQNLGDFGVRIGCTVSGNYPSNRVYQSHYLRAWRNYGDGFTTETIAQDTAGKVLYDGVIDGVGSITPGRIYSIGSNGGLYADTTHYSTGTYTDIETYRRRVGRGIPDNKMILDFG